MRGINDPDTGGGFKIWAAPPTGAPLTRQGR